MRQSRAPRVARGAVAASIATFAALMSHVAGGGSVPGWAGIAAPWVLALMVCTLLAGRRLSLVRLSISVLISQVLFHTLFVMGAPTTVGVGAGAHDHTAMAVLPTVSGAPLMGGWADPAMWSSHAFAAAVTIGLLYRAERAVRMLLALAAQVRAWARRVVARSVPASLTRLRLPRRSRIVSRPWVLRPAPHLSVLRRRGPPSIAAF